jgi:hypothetical protein
MSSNNSLSVSGWPCTLKILSSNISHDYRNLDIARLPYACHGDKFYGSLKVDEAVYHCSHVERDQE